MSKSGIWRRNANPGVNYHLNDTGRLFHNLNMMTMVGATKNNKKKNSNNCKPSPSRRGLRKPKFLNRRVETEEDIQEAEERFAETQQAVEDAFFKGLHLRCSTLLESGHSFEEVETFQQEETEKFNTIRDRERTRYRMWKRRVKQELETKMHNNDNDDNKKKRARSTDNMRYRPTTTTDTPQDSRSS